MYSDFGKIRHHLTKMLNELIKLYARWTMASFFLLPGMFLDVVFVVFLFLDGIFKVVILYHYALSFFIFML